MMSENNNFMGWASPGTALITGASAGIGAEFARQLAAQGFNLILLARRKDRLEALSKELQEKYSIKAEVWVGDLTNMAENERIIEQTAQLEDLDVLILNAGYGINGSWFDYSNQDNINMVTLHLMSPIMFCHAVLPGMIKRKRGVIITTSSGSAIAKTSLMYATTKNAVAYFTELLRKEVKERKIFFQALCPGFTYTEFHDVESMKGFRRDSAPEEYWMSAEECVSLSLAAVKTRQVIFVPGEFNLEMMKKVRKGMSRKWLNCKVI